MDMKTRYLLPLLALVAGNSFAAPRTLQQARSIAQEALSHYLQAEVSLSEASHRSPLRGSEAEQQAPYYLFNDDQQRGFILISGSDLMPEVLGYGTEPLDIESADQLPQSMRGWLQYISETQDYLEQHAQTAYRLQSARTAVSNPVGKLLTTEWGQDAPYCNQCPMMSGEQAITGCMATSISQVINYFEYPAQFEGTYSYKDKSVTRSLNFSDISIDYSLLADRYYRANTTAEQDNEVAKLMYSTGIAINMIYGLSRDGGSGAVTEMGVRGLRENLGHKKAQHLLRKYFTLDEWNKIIQEQLQNSRPVIMEGHSSEGGHSFVCDGVDNRGYYHINWGWDGMANGYFDVSILHPDQYGAGASEAADGFISSQDIIVNLGDPNQELTWFSPLYVDDGSSIRVNHQQLTLGSELALTARVHNTLPTSFKGYVGVLVMKDGEEYGREEGTLTSIDATRLTSTSRGGYAYESYGSANLTRSFTLPTNMPAGKYQIYMYVREQNSNQIDVIRQVQSLPNYYTATVSGNTVSLTNASDQLPFTPVAWSVDETPASTRPSTFSVDLSNDGDKTVAFIPYARFIRPNGSPLDYIQGNPILTIAPGEQGTASFDVEFDQVGEWTVQLCGIPIGYDVDYVISMCSKKFNVSLDATQGARFSISRKLEVASDKLYNVGPAEFSIGLANAGAEYHGQIAVRLYSSKTNTSSKYLQAEILNNLDFNAQTTDEVIISGNLKLTTLTVSQATLYARVFYLRGDAMEQLTTSASAVTIYRKEEAAIHDITVDQPDPLDFTGAEVYDVCGRRINVTGRLPRGIYIVNGQKKIIR